MLRFIALKLRFQVAFCQPPSRILSSIKTIPAQSC